LRVPGRLVPRNIGDGAQHRVEHDGARRGGGAEGAADRAVIVGDERHRVGAELGVRGGIRRRGRQHAVEDDPVRVEQMGFAHELAKLRLSARISG